ncbi:hypothetical protein Tco_1122321 [Tanacetum coccineum]|uniref:Uncharacterized protein n=1 Tax=Tanacetum coccineum TaxID=301880 RepID=A0ABQ5J070_9ASTR
MLAERRYPLTKNTLERMMDLRLTVVSDDDTVFDLLRFIEQQIDEFGGQDGKLAIPEQTATGKGISNPLMAGSLPKTTKPTNQERVKSILLLAIPDEYILKFHNVAYVKSLWEAIKSRFGGNIESKKMQKNILKHLERITKKRTKNKAKTKKTGLGMEKTVKDKAKSKPENESTAPTTVFRDDETIAEFLVSMSQNKVKQKGVEIKDVEDSDRPRATSTRSVLTLKPLPKIDPKDKGKKVLEEEAESDVELEGVDEAKRKFNQLAKDEEIARKVQEDWEVEEEMKKLAKEEATKAALIQDFDDIHARIEADRLLAARLQEEERETSDKNFIAIGSAEDERQIKEMNEESKDPKKKRLKKRVVNETLREEDTAKVPAEQEVTEQGTKKRKSGHVKMIARKRPRPQPDDDSDDEHRKCLRIVTFDSTIDSEIMETKSFVSKLHKVSSPDGDYLVVYRVNGHFKAFNYLMDGDLKIMMESSTKENDQGDFWNNQQDWEIVSWRLYEACGVCILEFKDGIVIYMLVERSYPLSKELLQRMLDLGLEVEEESTAALHLVRFIKQQLNEEHQELTSPEANGFCEELASPGSNSSWLSIHLVVYNEELAIPEQTATGKGISNPLMAGSLPKTTKPT